MGKFKWSVVQAVPHDDYTIDILFYDGSRGIYDAKHLLDWPVFKPLKDKALFMQAHASNGTVVWNDGIDIAPETLYEESNRTNRASAAC